MAISTKWDSLPQGQLEAIADAGDCEAQFTLANRLIQKFASKNGTPKDAVSAAQWYRRAAEQGHGNAQYRLGLAYAKGEGVVEDLTEATKWYLRASTQGNAWADYRLGECYRSGSGVTQDRSKAAKSFERAAVNGIDAAQSFLNVMRAEDESRAAKAKPAPAIQIPPQNSPPALVIHAPAEVAVHINATDRKAANAATTTASEGTKAAVERTAPVLEDDCTFAITPEARWMAAPVLELVRAAQSGIAEAQFRLGWTYILGSGDLPQDAELALKWFRKAAEQGMAKAQSRLAAMYLTGNDVPQNYIEAERWFRKAAEQGDDGAQTALNRLLERTARVQTTPTIPAERPPIIEAGKVQAQRITPLPQPPVMSESSPPGRKGWGILYPVGMIGVIGAGIGLVVLTNGNALLVVLFAIPVLVIGVLIWGLGATVAEKLFDREIGPGEKPGMGRTLVGVGIVVVGLFLLLKFMPQSCTSGPSHEDDFDGSSRMRP